jgi:hypothetical protein
MANIKQLSDGGPDGSVFGQSAADKIAFYAGTPTAQGALTVIGALTAGETTPADIAAAVFELSAYLVARGLYTAT